MFPRFSPRPMNLSSRWFARAVSLFAAGLAASPSVPCRAADPSPKPIRVVNCDEKVASTKRGVCANELSEEDFRLLAPGISWFYNWHYETKDRPPMSASMEFIPMAWGDRPADLAGLQKYLEQTPKKPRVVLAINEPNLRGQAFISPEKTADLYRRVKEVADRYQIPAVGPNMSLGSADNDSIKAMDPVQNKEVTYTFMVPFLDAFLHYVGNVNVPATAFHSYGALGELKWAVGMMHEKFNRPVWVTEYAQWKTDSAEDARKYLMQATDFLERTPYVAGYAWFKERVKDNQSISLLANNASKLTPMGEAYVALPPHDDNLYYRIPGRLQAENYAASDKEEINPTGDTNGFAFMGSESPQGWLEYHLQVDAAGPYVMKFRIGGAAGKVEILQGDKVIGQLQPADQPGWQTAETSVNLMFGAQKLRVRLEKSNQAINWIEFARR